jgi:RNA-directed DNA polymerase
MQLEPEVEKVFHPDSYGYRPGRSALDAVGVCRERCWRYDWVIDLDIRAFFDSIDHQLLLKAVARHTEQRWVMLYVERWLTAPLQREDATLVERDRGTPQGSAMTPPTQWITGAQKGVVSHGDAVADGNAFGSDEDFFDHAA